MIKNYRNSHQQLRVDAVFAKDTIDARAVEEELAGKPGDRAFLFVDDLLNEHSERLFHRCKINQLRLTDHKSHIPGPTMPKQKKLTTQSTGESMWKRSGLRIPIVGYIIIV